MTANLRASEAGVKLPRRRNKPSKLKTKLAPDAQPVQKPKPVVLPVEIIEFDTYTRHLKISIWPNGKWTCSCAGYRMFLGCQHIVDRRKERGLSLEGYE